MKKIRAIIIDDEPINNDNLRALLNLHCKTVDVVTCATSADEARIKILELAPDVIFLDIEMPGKNGFDLLKSIKDPDFEVIFVTAYDTFGIMAIKFSALDYLLKPINISALKIAVNKLERSLQVKTQNQRLNNLLYLLDKTQPEQNEKIALPTQKETYLVPVKDIIRCESSNNYTTFFLTNGMAHVISRPLYEYEELLEPYGFIRCHQTHLVNKTHVTKILNEDSGYLVVNYTDKKIPIAKQRKSVIRALLNMIGNNTNKK